MYTLFMEVSITSLPAHVMNALDAIWEGSIADSLESETLEFKEDPACAGRGKPHGNPQAALIEKLIDEAVCLANGDAGTGHIVVGIKDKIGGPEAFTGTTFDTEKIAKKIFDGTRPNLRPEVHEVRYQNNRLIVIYIPEALSLYSRSKGQTGKRVGSHCEPLSEEQRRAIAATRAHADYSNGISEFNVDDIAADTIQEVRRLLKTKRAQSGIDTSLPTTTNGLLRELGLIDNYGALKRAGAILLLPAPEGQLSIRHFWRSFPGIDPEVTDYNQPLLIALSSLKRRITENTNKEIKRIQFSDGQEIAVSAFPQTAVDEVVTNAIIHRDWRLSRPVVIDQSPQTLKVWSPGSLPVGVTPNRLLTTQSIPRNSRLMSAMRMLGLAEESSRGFDRIWAALLGSGRDIPDVHTEDTFVEVILHSGNPDESFIKALHELSLSFNPDVLHSVNTLIVLWHLWTSPVISLKQARVKTQTSSKEATELMFALESNGLLTQIHNTDEWFLSEKARKTTDYYQSQTIPQSSVQTWVEEKLSSGSPISAAEIAESIGMPRPEITEILRNLRRAGKAHIDPSGPQRGSGTRWIKGT
ncbi:AAA family ATPase [Corynebacterium diphtheriae bv. mitis]|nr:AAA family ATPase [Corynebacterium diphtheriae bv. mitis]OWO29527.1 AAA family ATPase [Corynebacterium diphtheriae bv. mitis]